MPFKLGTFGTDPKRTAAARKKYGGGAKPMPAAVAQERQGLVKNMQYWLGQRDKYRQWQNKADTDTKRKLVGKMMSQNALAITNLQQEIDDIDFMYSRKKHITKKRKELSGHMGSTKPMPAPKAPKKKRTKSKPKNKADIRSWV